MKLPTPVEQCEQIINKWSEHISSEALPGLHKDIAEALEQRDNARVRPVTVLSLMLAALAFITLQFGGPAPVIFGVLAMLVGVSNLFTAED